MRQFPHFKKYKKGKSKMKQSLQKKKCLLVIFILFSLSTVAQIPVKRSGNIRVENNRRFYIHIVEPGQTMYSICKAYDVTQKEIAAANSLYDNEISVGQELKIPAVYKNRTTKQNFIEHQVKRKETLYSIAKKYGISVDDVLKFNPGARNGININDVLRIIDLTQGDFDYQTEIYHVYTVSKGETMFSIAQKFGKTSEQVLLFNPDARQGLKVGQVLKIPKHQYAKNESLTEYISGESGIRPDRTDPLYFEDPNIIPCGKYKYNPQTVFNIAVMLPLYLSENASHIADSDKREKMYYKNTKRFFEMYQGILLAVQQLKVEGLSLNLRVYDTENNPEVVRQISAKPEFESLDLIIGPIYTANVKALSWKIKKHRINLVNPLSQNTELIENNPFIFQITPSQEMMIRKASDFLSCTDDSGIVIIHNGSEEDTRLSDIFRQKLTSSVSGFNHPDDHTVKIINFKTGGTPAIENALSPGVENHVVITSTDEVFVTQMMNKLDLLTKKYHITLYGNPIWDDFQNIEFKSIKNLKLKYISSTFVDYNNWRVKSFIKKYREAYRTEPSIFAFQGYDIAYYFGTALKKYGRHFQFCLSPFDSEPNPKGLSLRFDFSRIGSDGGFENNGVNILDFDNNMVPIKAETEN